MCDGINDIKDMRDINDIRERLFALADEKYKDFQSALMPTVDKSKVIGVRTPLIKKLAKELKNTPLAEEFLNDLPHKYYEEDNLHAFLLNEEKDFNKAVSRLDAFLPFIDNWATCDAMRIKAFEKDLAGAEKAAYNWLDRSGVYEKRFAIVTFMKLFTGEYFNTKQADKIAAVRSDEYYVNSAIAWYFATLLTKRYADALPYITQKKLDKATHNLAIQKARESLAVPTETKKYLNTLKI